MPTSELSVVPMSNLPRSVTVIGTVVLKSQPTLKTPEKGELLFVARVIAGIDAACTAAGSANAVTPATRIAKMDLSMGELWLSRLRHTRPRRRMTDGAQCVKRLDAK